MKFASSLVVLALSAYAFALRASYDEHYDDASASTNIVACSTLTPQFPTLGSFPTFPNIGGASVISGFGDPNCGSCWNLTDNDTGKSIIVTAIDHTDDGFNLSLEALNTLTNNNAVFQGVAQVTVARIEPSFCGL